VLEGDLSDFSLPDILRLLAFTSKSGELRLQQGDATGRVVLVDGHVRDVSADARRLPLARRLLGTHRVDPAALRAVLTGRETLPSDGELASLLIDQGHVDAETAATAMREQAVDGGFDLLRWRSGSFRFDTAEGDARERLARTTGTLDLTVDALLSEVDARRDAWNDLAERTGDATAVATIVRPPAPAEARVAPDGWELLALIDGRRSIGELVELSGRGEFASRRTLAALLEQGVVQVGPPGNGAATERLLTAHRELTALEAKLAGGDAGGSAGRGEAAAPTPDDARHSWAATWEVATPATAEAPVPAASAAVAAPQAAAPQAQEASAPEPSAPEASAAGGAEGTAAGRIPPADAPRETLFSAPAAASEPSSADRSDERSDTDDRAQPATSMPVLATTGQERPSAATPTTIPPSVPSVTPLRTRVRADRISTDPTIDPDLVTRLIDGVERL
jgi:hypothetical protein